MAMMRWTEVCCERMGWLWDVVVDEYGGSGRELRSATHGIMD
jgi:hypothetical protein